MNNDIEEPYPLDQSFCKTNDLDISLEHLDDFLSLFPIDVEDGTEDIQQNRTFSTHPNDSTLGSTIQSSIKDINTSMLEHDWNSVCSTSISETNTSVLDNDWNTVCSTPSLANSFDWWLPLASLRTETQLVPKQVKPFHELKWYKRFQAFIEFKKENGHGAVPHTYPKNPQLASWVKRQRRQYKLRQEGQPSTMTRKRLDLLNSVDFMWDAHEVNWRERLHALKQFRRVHGHCNVPVNHKEQKLGMWVKCQRRQYKLYKEGKKSAINPERIFELNQMGFEWEMTCKGVSQKSRSTK